MTMTPPTNRRVAAPTTTVLASIIEPRTGGSVFTANWKA
jgi:hypothetical protein